MKSEVRSPRAEVGRTLVCFALKEEAAAFRELAKGRAVVRLLLTGIGRENARTAVGEALARDNPERVFTCGFAGGLNPELAVGDVVFETSDGALGQGLAAAGARVAKFHCASRIAVTAVEKEELCRATGADAVEMESAAIHALCGERGISCATVRVISDPAHEDLPLDFNQLAKPDLSLDYGKLALALVKSPGKIPALRRLQQQAAFAAERLAQVLARVIWPQ